MSRRKFGFVIVIGMACVVLIVTGFFSSGHIWRTPPLDFPLPLWSIGFMPDGKTLITGGAQGSPLETPGLGELIFWNTRNGKKNVVRQPWGVRTLAVSPDGQFIAIGKCNGSTELVMPGSGKLLATLPPRSTIVNSIAVSGDGKLVVSGSFDGTISLWNVSTRREETLVLPKEKIVNVAISPGTSAVVATTRSGHAYLFDLVDHGVPKVLEAYSGTQGEASVEAVGFKRNGQTFATGCHTSLRMWEIGSGKLLREFRGVTADVLGIAFAPNADTLAAVDAAGVLTLWNSETGDRIAYVQSHFGPSFGIAFSADGKYLATVGVRDYAARVWDAQTLSPMAAYYRAVFTLRPQ